MNRAPLPLFLIVLAALVSTLPLDAQPEQKKYIVVWEVFPSKAVKKVDIGILTEILRGEVTTILSPKGYSVITEESVALILKEQGKSMETCENETSCLIEVAGAYGAEFSVSATLGMVDKKYALQLKLYETRTGAMISSQGMTATTQEELVAELKKNSALLFLELAGREERETESGAPVVEIDVQSNPSGAAVSYNGKAVCEATPCKVEARWGTGVFEIYKKDYLKKELELTVKKGMKPIAVTLTPAFALISATTQPEGLFIVINGKVIGKSPLSNYKISPGKYSVSTGDEVWKETSEEIELKAGDSKSIELQAERRVGKIRIEATDSAGNPVEGMATINGEIVGPVNTEYLAPIGEHRIGLESERGSAQTETAVVEEEQVTTKRLEAKLYPANPYKIWGHALFWPGLASTGAGFVLMGISSRAADDYRQSGRENDADRSRQLAGAMWFCLGEGVLMMGTSILLWALSPGDKIYSESHGFQAAELPRAHDGAKAKDE
jgi:hypothetical protein